MSHKAPGGATKVGATAAKAPSATKVGAAAAKAAGATWAKAGATKAFLAGGTQQNHCCRHPNAALVLMLGTYVCSLAGGLITLASRRALWPAFTLGSIFSGAAY